jgi:hypothetical protein
VQIVSIKIEENVGPSATHAVADLNRLNPARERQKNMLKVFGVIGGKVRDISARATSGIAFPHFGDQFSECHGLRLLSHRRWSGFSGGHPPRLLEKSDQRR